jgi:hypothetical protein
VKPLASCKMYVVKLKIQTFYLPYNVRTYNWKSRAKIVCDSTSFVMDCVSMYAYLAYCNFDSFMDFTFRDSLVYVIAVETS